MSLTVSMFVEGIPSPSGSKKAFAHPKTRKIIVMDTAKRKDSWQSIVAMYARKAMTDKEIDMFTGPVRMTIYFTFTRPKSHFGTGKNAETVKDSAPRFHVVKPDLTKLIRCAEDALTGIVYKDDSQVVQRSSQKYYSDKNGCFIRVDAITR